MACCLIGAAGLAGKPPAEWTFKDDWSPQRGRAVYNESEKMFRIEGCGWAEHSWRGRLAPDLRAGYDPAFLYQKFEGDFDIIVRLVRAAHGKAHPNATAGLMAVSKLTGSSSAVALAAFKMGGLKRVGQPVWLRLIRKDGRVGAYESIRGEYWYNKNSGAVLPGTVYVGMYTSGRQNPTTAWFDHVTVNRNPVFTYSTTWLGNNLAGRKGNTINSTMVGLGVLPDGTCITTTSMGEVEVYLARYREGLDITPSKTVGKQVHKCGIAIAIDTELKRGWVSKNGGLIPFQFDGLARLRRNPIWLVKTDPKRQVRWRHNAVRGIAVGKDHLYASVRPDHQIAVLNKETLKEIRRFKFERPGPLALDAAGRLWVIQENYFGHVLDTKWYKKPARLVAVDPATGRQLMEIKGLGLPVALAADEKAPRKSRLLVADNGPDQQIKLYDVGGPRPKLIGVVGAKGGMFAGMPGRVDDCKFNGFAGIGTDATGNIYATTTGWAYRYVPAGAMPLQTELKCLPPAAINNPDAKALWKVHNIGHNIEGAGWDRKTGDIYVGSDARYEVDWSRPVGREARWAGYILNARDDPDGIIWRWNRSPPSVRWLDGRKFLFARTQGGLLEVFRFTEEMGEIGIPCTAYICNRKMLQKYAAAQKAWADKDPSELKSGDKAQQDYFWSYASRWLPELPMPKRAGNGKWERTRLKWVDGSNGGNRDGRVQPVEYSDVSDLLPQGARETGHHYFVDQKGGLWHVDPNRGQPIAYEPFAGVKDGIPHWGRKRLYALPNPFTWVAFAFYDTDTDAMTLVGGTKRFPGNVFVNVTAARRYEKWTSGAPTAGPLVTFPPPAVWHIPGGHGNWWRPGIKHRAVSASAADHYLFVTNRTGQIRVIDMKLGNLVEWLVAGPEVLGGSGSFEGRLTGVNAYRFKDGEYLILRQDNATVRLLVHRWKPADSAKLPVRGNIRPWARPADGAVELTWGGQTGVTGPLNGYGVYRAATKEGPYRRINPALVPTSRFVDKTLRNGATAWYRVAAVGVSGDEGPKGPPVRGAAARPQARQVTSQGRIDAQGYDRKTRGNWRGVYGKDAAIIAGDSTGKLDQDATAIKLPDYAWFRFRPPSMSGGSTTASDKQLLAQAALVPGKRCDPGRNWVGRPDDPVRFYLDLNDGKPHRITMYLGPHGHGGHPLEPTIRFLDGRTGNVVLEAKLPRTPRGGKWTARGTNRAYASWIVSGRLEITVAGAQVLGIFFDPPSRR